MWNLCERKNTRARDPFEFLISESAASGVQPFSSDSGSIRKRRGAEFGGWQVQTFAFRFEMIWNALPPSSIRQARGVAWGFGKVKRAGNLEFRTNRYTGLRDSGRIPARRGGFERAARFPNSASVALQTEPSRSRGIKKNADSFAKDSFWQVPVVCFSIPK